MKPWKYKKHAQVFVDKGFHGELYYQLRIKLHCQAKKSQSRLQKL